MNPQQKSIVNEEYAPPTRPYSQDELSDNRSALQRRLYLGSSLIQHKNCGHSYLVKKGGKKDQQFKSSGDPDCGNCSVCWKIKSIRNKKQRGITEDMVDAYTNLWGDHDENVSSWHEKNDIYNVFYTWLYIENTPRKKFNGKKSNESQDTVDDPIQIEGVEN